MSPVSLPQFRFTFKRIDADPGGYFFPRWDKAVEVTAIGATETDARAAVRQMSGETPRPGWYWAMRLVRAEQVVEVTS